MPLIKKCTALATALFFSWTVLVGTTTGITLASPVPKPVEVPSSPFSEALPAELGEVVHFHAASGNQGPWAIHIQDAHANPDAQKNIVKILAWIENHTRLDKDKKNLIPVAIEGAAGELHPEYLNFFPDFPEVNETMIQDLAAKGELEGAELFAWDQYRKKKQRFKFLGVEDAAVYRRDLKSYRKVLFAREKIKSLLGSFERNLNRAQSRLLSPALQKLLREKQHRKEGDYGARLLTPQLEPYLEYLRTELSGRLKIDLNDPLEQLRFPNLNRLLAITRLTHSFDPAQAEKEAQIIDAKLAAAPRDKGSRNVLVSLKGLERFQNARPVFEKALPFFDRDGISLRDYPQYQKRAGIAILQNELDGEGLWEELDRCEQALEKQMSPNAAEKKLLDLIHRTEMLEKILFLKTKSEELNAKQFLERRQNPASIDAELRNLLPEVPAQNSQIALLGKYYQEALNFYRTAVKRDRILAEQFRGLLLSGRGLKSRPSYGILIAGGFHTPGLTARLEHKNINYVVIRPRIHEIDGGVLYDQVMRDEHAGLAAGVKQPGFSKQEALFLKCLLEVGFPQLAKMSELSQQDMTRRLVDLINHHPVFSGHLEARMQKTDKNPLLQIFRSPLKPAVLPVPGQGMALSAQTIRDAVLLVAPDAFIRLRGRQNPQSFHSLVSTGQLLGNVRWDAQGQGSFTPRLLPRMPRSEVRGTTVTNPNEFLRVGFLGLGREDLSNAGVLTENGHHLTIAAQDQGKLLAKITSNGLQEFSQKDVLFRALTAGQLDILIRPAPDHLDEFLKGKDVIVIASRLGEGLEYKKFKKEMLELAHKMGEALARIRKTDTARKVIILRDHLGVGSADLFYKTMRTGTGALKDRNFDVVYSPNFGQRDEKGKSIEKTMVFGLRDTRIPAALQNRNATKTILEKLYPSTVVKWSNIRSAEIAYEAYLVLAAAKLTHFQSQAPLAEAIDGNVHEAAFGAGMDRRIGTDKINPSLAFGGQLALLLDWILQGRLEDIFSRPGDESMSRPEPEVEAMKATIKQQLKNAVKQVAETSQDGKSIEAILAPTLEAINAVKGETVAESDFYLPLLLEIIESMNHASMVESSKKILKVLSGKDRIKRISVNDLHDKVVAILGVGFREKDSQITKSPVLDLIDRLVSSGVGHFRISDPFAVETFKRWVEDQKKRDFLRYGGVLFEYSSQGRPLSLYEAVEGADITVVAQESHPELKNLDLQELARRLNGKPFFDGIGLFGRRANGTDPVYTFAALKKLPRFNLVSLGRPPLKFLVDSKVYKSAAELQKAGIQFKKKRITVMGGGYVGLVTAAKLAQMGHEVWVYDVVKGKIDMLSKINPDEIITPIYEPGLQERLREMAKLGRFHATLDLKEALHGSDAVYVAVPTPQGDDGSANLGYIETAADSFAKAWKELQSGSPARLDPVPFVIKSTVPPEAIHMAQNIFLKAGFSSSDITAVSNPEFLKEGTAINDVDAPDRTLIGIPAELSDVQRQAVERVLLEIWMPLMESHPNPFLLTTPEVTTKTKYGANSLLAIDITLATILAQEAINHDADFNEVIGILKSLDSIGPFAFINPGCWGGSCFPKDVRALNALSKKLGKRPLPLIEFVDMMNQRFADQPLEVAEKILGYEVSGSTVAFFGMTFKPDTDDVRETPAANLVLKTLLAWASQIRMHDPIALEKPIEDIWKNFMGEILKVAQSDRAFQELFLEFLKQPENIPGHYLAALFFAVRQKGLLERFRKLPAVKLTAEQERYFEASFPEEEIKASFERRDAAVVPFMDILLQEIATVDLTRPQQSKMRLLRELFLREIFLKDGSQGWRDRVIFTRTIKDAVKPDPLTQQPVKGIFLMTDWLFYKKLTAENFDELQKVSGNHLRFIVDTRSAWNDLAVNYDFSELGIDYASNRIPPIFSQTDDPRVRSELRRIDANKDAPAFLEDMTLSSASMENRAGIFAAGFSNISPPSGSILRTAAVTEGIFSRVPDLSKQLDISPLQTYAVLISQILSGRTAHSGFTQKVRQLAQKTLGRYAALFTVQTDESIHLVFPTDSQDIPDAVFALLALAAKNDQVDFLVSRSAQDAKNYNGRMQDRLTAQFGSTAIRQRLNIAGAGTDGVDLMKMLEKAVSSPNGGQVGIPLTQKNLLEQSRYMGPRRYRFDAVRLNRDLALFLSYVVLKKQLPDGTGIYGLEETARSQGIDPSDMIAHLQQFLAEFHQLAAAA